MNYITPGERGGHMSERHTKSWDSILIYAKCEIDYLPYSEKIDVYNVWEVMHLESLTDIQVLMKSTHQLASK